MSRIGKLPVALPSGVEVKTNGRDVEVKGPGGTLKRTLPPEVALVAESGSLRIEPRAGSPAVKSLWGLSRTLVSNMVEGVHKGFSKTLEIVGVGWKVEEEGKDSLRFSLGFSHPVLFKLPPGVSSKVEAKAGKITLISADKELLGQTAATIRRLRPPEPYKGKGIKYQGEVIRRKVGKAGGK
ncbi:MAG: 50S ribosomal protein L6 [Deltaproteobacteria bacterium]|jgi:large subunit ribosomal protein L6|nr:50S ribosomal protein L6 [Deltaproteobacteria bacterium]